MAQERMDVLCPALMQENATWGEWFARPDFYIYRTLVALLYSEQMWNGWTEAEYQAVLAYLRQVSRRLRRRRDGTNT